MASRLDSVYRKILFTKFFTKGWGNPKNMKRLFEFRQLLANRETCCQLVPKDYPVSIDKVEEFPTYVQMSGHFITPLVHYLPEVVPQESQKANFQVLLPKTWPYKDIKPLVIQLAGTGDHFFWRRRNLMARPLLKEAAVGSILLENPFYGTRKPESQIRSSLHNVSDIFVMGACLVLECLVLLRWSLAQGLGPLGLTGISMGGHRQQSPNMFLTIHITENGKLCINYNFYRSQMASLAACNWEKPISVVPCLSWTTASCAFTQGVLSGAIPWGLLENQYFSDHVYKEDIMKMLHEQPHKNSGFSAGYEFSSLHSNSTGQLNGSFHQLSVALELLSRGKGSLKQEVIDFMRGIMDECTHLNRFPCPLDPSLIVAVAARKDGYIPREDSLQELWPGCEVRYLDCGHIAAFLFNQSFFRKAILDSLERNAVKYYNKSLFR